MRLRLMHLVWNWTRLTGRFNPGVLRTRICDAWSPSVHLEPRRGGGRSRNPGNATATPCPSPLPLLLIKIMCFAAQSAPQTGHCHVWSQSAHLEPRRGGGRSRNPGNATATPTPLPPRNTKTVKSTEWQPHLHHVHWYKGSFVESCDLQHKVHPKGDITMHGPCFCTWNHIPSHCHTGEAAMDNFWAMAS